MLEGNNRTRFDEKRHIRLSEFLNDVYFVFNSPASSLRLPKFSRDRSPRQKSAMAATNVVEHGEAHPPFSKEVSNSLVFRKPKSSREQAFLDRGQP